MIKAPQYQILSRAAVEMLADLGGPHSAAQRALDEDFMYGGEARFWRGGVNIRVEKIEPIQSSAEGKS